MKKEDNKIEKAKQKLDKWIKNHNVIVIKKQVHLDKLTQEEYNEYLSLFVATLSEDEARKFVLSEKEREINEFFDNIIFDDEEDQKYCALIRFNYIKELYKIYLFQEYIKKHTKDIDLKKLCKKINLQAANLMVKNMNKKEKMTEKCVDDLKCYLLGFNPSTKTLKSKGNPEFN